MSTLVIASEEAFVSKIVAALEKTEAKLPRVLFQRIRSDLPPPVLPQNAIVGDLGAIDFGLPGAAYRSLVREIERVIVAVLPERAHHSELERSRHVRITSEVAEFVRAGAAKKGVTFLSSLLVFGDAEGPVLEADFQIGQSFSGIDEEILAVSERIVRRVATETPLKILRTAPLVGDLETREFLPESGLLEIVRRAEQASGITEVALHGLPIRFETIDRAAAALVRLHAIEESLTAHLVDKMALTDRSLVRLLGEHFGKEFREPLASARGRRAQSALFELRGPEKRSLAGWGVTFHRAEAERRFADLLDRDPEETLNELLVGRDRAFS